MSKRLNKTDADHFNRVEDYASRVDGLYRSAIKEATRIAASANIDTTKPFNLNDYPAIKARVQNVLKYLFKNIEINIQQASALEWNFSNDVNDEIVKSLFPDTDPKKYMNQNLDALKAFQNRKINGMNLSQRVWKLKDQLQGELEMSIDVGLSDGRSAAQLSQDVRQYLNNPEMLFRRVRDSRGVLELSKRAANYHPGRGVYRSSYKNAMRLTRTEINMSYRTSDHERRQQLDFITGFEVKISNNHPVTDICDDLKGKYPKEFKFVGWHPQCRCKVITILCSKEELSDLTDKILNGEDTDKFRSVNQVENVPSDFKRWIVANEERAKRWKSKPYFMVDNPQFVK